MDMTKCIYNPVHDCEYAGCYDCPDYAEITDSAPDPDEIYEIRKENDYVYNV